MRPDVPIRELSVLARDESVELHRADQRVDACGAGRILIEPIFEHPFVRVLVRPGIESGRALPKDRFVIGREYGGRSRNRAREVVNKRGFGHDLR